MPSEPLHHEAFLTEFSALGAKAPAVRGHRSKGCLTCRRRKVKCDERKPTCERCEKGFHKCLGYDKPLVFVPQQANRGSTPSKTKEEPGSSPKSNYSQQSTDEWTVVLLNRTGSPRETVKKTVPPTMQLHGFKDEIVISHLLEKFRIGFAGKFSRGTDAPTMRAILTTGKGQSNAYLSGLGLAEAFFGRTQKVNDLVFHSAELYGRALRNLRDDLQLTDKSLAQERAYMNIWNCVFLGLYELVTSTNASNWLQHTRGVAALTEMLGPEAFQAPIANSMLETYRSTIATGYLIERKRCFLEEFEWQTVPWILPTSDKSLTSCVVDILCDIPGLMEASDSLLENESSGIDVQYSRANFQNKIIDRIQRLSSLLWQWELTNPIACWEAPLDPLITSSYDPSGKPLFDSVLHFEGFDLAVDVVNFNAIRLLLYRLQDDAGLSESFVLSMLGNEYQGPHSNPLLLPGQGSRLDNAIEICRTVDYFLQPRLENHGALVLMFPLRVAYGHLALTKPHLAAWIGTVLEQLTSSKGFGMSKHVLKMGAAPKSPTPQGGSPVGQSMHGQSPNSKIMI